VAACPAQCIQLDTAQPDREPLADGLPYIIARQSPCVVCSDLSCMKACPTGALQLVAQPADIHMGVAVIDHRRCLRGPEGYQPGSPAGEDCQLCVTQCPLGGSAIGFDAAGRVQVRRGCVGCGVCERACPTEPASIFVQPFDRLP
jgi:ferredoxin-type protein NapG